MSSIDTVYLVTRTGRSREMATICCAVVCVAKGRPRSRVEVDRTFLSPIL